MHCSICLLCVSVVCLSDIYSCANYASVSICCSVTTDLHNISFSEVPILSLCNKVEGLEGKSRLELVLLKPASACPDQGHTLWSGCMWELHLCEMVEQHPEENAGEEELEEDQSQDKDKEGGGGEEEETDTEPPLPVFLATKTVLCRWADSASFDSSAWHSIALTLQASGSGGGSAGGDSGEGGSGTATEGNVELTVDGTGRMKVDGPFEEGEGIAAAWLPAPQNTKPSEGKLCYCMWF